MVLVFAIAFLIGVQIFLFSVIFKRLDRLEQVKPELASRLELYLETNGQLTRWETMAVFKAGEEKRAKLQIKDKFGNPAKVDGAPTWSALDPALASLEVDADGMGALVKSLGPMGESKVQVSADADLGEGVKPLLAEGDLEVIAGDAEVIELSFE